MESFTEALEQLCLQHLLISPTESDQIIFVGQHFE